MWGSSGDNTKPGWPLRADDGVAVDIVDRVPPDAGLAVPWHPRGRGWDARPYRTAGVTARHPATRAHASSRGPSWSTASPIATGVRSCPVACTSGPAAQTSMVTENVAVSDWRHHHRVRGVRAADAVLPRPVRNR